MSSDSTSVERADTPVPPEPAAGREGLKASLAHRVLTVSAERTDTISVSAYVSPADLKAYQEIDPELARLVVEHNLACATRAAEEEQKESAHRRELEKTDQAAEIRDRELVRSIELGGQRWAGGIALAGFCLCGVALGFGHPTAAIWLGCTMIVSLVGAFLAGRWMATTGEEGTDSGPEEGAT